MQKAKERASDDDKPMLDYLILGIAYPLLLLVALCREVSSCV